MKERKRSKIERGKSKAIRAIALSQVSLLVLEIFAFSFIFSLSLGVVSAQSQQEQILRKTSGIIQNFLDNPFSAFWKVPPAITAAPTAETPAPAAPLTLKQGYSMSEGSQFVVGNNGLTVDEFSGRTQMTGERGHYLPPGSTYTVPEGYTAVVKSDAIITPIQNVQIAYASPVGPIEVSSTEVANGPVQVALVGRGDVVIPSGTDLYHLSDGAVVIPAGTEVLVGADSKPVTVPAGGLTITSSEWATEQPIGQTFSAIKDTQGQILISSSSGNVPYKAGDIFVSGENSYKATADGTLPIETITSPQGKVTGTTTGLTDTSKFQKVGGAAYQFVSEDGKTITRFASQTEANDYAGTHKGTLKPLPPAAPPGGAGGAGVSKQYALPWGGTWDTKSYFLGNMVEGLSIAAWTLTFTGLIGAAIGGEKGKEVQQLGLAISAGVMAGKTVYGLTEAMTNGKTGPLGTTLATVAGIAVAYLIAANNLKETKTREASIEFKCMAWQAPNGGEDCNKCNQDPFRPCSEYRCRALGQSCTLINAGTGLDRCINSAPNDVTSPGIKPWNNALTPGYEYYDVKPRPPGKSGTTGTSGMKIRDAQTKGCLKAFTAFDFGIVTTDIGDVTQPAQCKIDFTHTNATRFDDMSYYMGETNLYIENHTQRISLPGTDTLNKTFPGVKNDGEYTLYIRCKDGNGNENEDEFAVRFCIDKEPDATAPVIKKTSIPSGSPVLYKVDNVSLSVYTNEPSKCRWSRRDASYSNMENQMSCSNNVWEMNAEYLYTCTTTLTAVKDKEENNFYFRCQDISPKNNTMSESYNYKLIGTQPLSILSTAPNGTVGSSTATATVSLRVQTDNGYKNGEATCYYSTAQAENTYVSMFETGGNSHKQDLDLTGGNYTYYFKCVDAGGNTAYNSTSFNVFIDKFAPAILRAYNYEGHLVITTSEESKCRYSTSSCNFDISKDEGTSMPYDFDVSRVHSTEWETDQTYFIKCADQYNNQPGPSECSLILRPFSLPAAEYG